MGSPITLSGFNNIDFSLILNAIMEQERAPVAALQTRTRDLEARSAKFGTFASKLGALESAAEALGRLDSLALVSASSSDPSAVTVSPSSSTVEGSYQIVVSELARAQVTASASTYASRDDIVADSGTLTLTESGQAPVQITLSGPVTLQQLADAINAAENTPVVASIIEASPGVHRLVLTGRSTGTAHAFTLSHTLSGGAGVSFTDTDANGITGDSAADNAQTALDAAFTVNNIAVTSSSNVVDGVIPGATLTLLKKDPAATVSISVRRDADKAAGLVEDFIEAYNAVIEFIQSESPSVASGQTGIGRDPLVRGLRDELRRALFAEYPEGGALTRLAAIGLGVDASGKLVLDRALFDKAFAESIADVQKLFAGNDGSGGAFNALASLIEDYTEAGGLISDTRERLDAQLRDVRARLDDLEARLEVRRRALQQEFIAADLAISQLRSQSSSLSSLGGQYRLF